MKAFLTGLLLIVVISAGAWAVLDRIPNSAADRFSSSNVRL